ncbi:3-oxoacyl-ACP reductase FabG [Arcicella sp. LKC2W]|uniref:3-oxoacyl-ACP reductase FabG n=1 Tax=Arcicella sp. LKC2W TaxID=2984198 RepID=UPI002B20DE2C|nr:3-oxoacyl-ACP reductase FabG [Arcicella sp. LKC2W]MEA5460844.1 3-oxoacyl-ACP reductase FabG [Arcicella sp. LKC2W]
MKYALVTGGSRGIGRAICLKMAEMGYNVLINYVSNEEKAREVQTELIEKGVKAEILQFDVADQTQVDDSINTWISNNPEARIEVLVNNAGIRKDRLLMSMTNEEWYGVMNTGIGGFYNVTRLIIREMIKKKYGRVINIVSLSGLTGLPGQTNYSASKAAIIGATKALAQEVGRKNITVNAIAPGFIRTDMIHDISEEAHKGMIPMKRFGEPEEVAELVGFIASSKASYITSQVLEVNGGLHS